MRPLSLCSIRNSDQSRCREPITAEVRRGSSQMKLPNYSNSLASKEPSRERLEYRRPSHLVVYLLVLYYLVIFLAQRRLTYRQGYWHPVSASRIDDDSCGDHCHRDGASAEIVRTPPSILRLLRVFPVGVRALDIVVRR